jgi:predicted exporter
LTEARVRALWMAAAALWLLVVLAVAAHQWRFWHEGRLNTDVLSLLPQDEHEPDVSLATRKLADRASRQVVVMVGAPDWPGARKAAAAWRESLAASGAPLKPAEQALESGLAAGLAFYTPWRDRLLTPAQREQLAREPSPAQVQAALAALHQPGVAARLSDWRADPTGLWPQWWSARAAQSHARPREGMLAVSGDGMEWVVLPHEITGRAFALDGDAVIGDALRNAQARAMQATPGARVIAAGVPLHAEAAAVQASREINTIGWGSLAAVLLLVWLAFRSLRPIALVAVSLGVGTAAALSVTAAIFHEVHLLTLVFGASLVGVAEDYGIHYFASRQGEPQSAPRGLMRKLLPGLLLALATSALAYLVMGLAPFPGLRQMAVFSAAGLTAAFLTVACWFPFLDRGTVPRSSFADAVAASLDRWPRWQLSRRSAVACAIALVLCIGGWLQLRTGDDIRQLQNSPAALVRDQIEVGTLLAVPSVAQFYLVRGDSVQQLLEREEALKARLDPLVKEGGLSGYSALSDWVPSAARQQADAALTQRAETAVLAGVGKALGETFTRPAFSSSPLTLEAWLAQPASALGRNLWLGEGGKPMSVVLLGGLRGQAQAARLQTAAVGLEGVRWVDKAAEISSLMQRYRVSMTWLLAAGHIATLLALFWRYGRNAWRAWVPTVLATGLTIALLGWLGQPLQLFNVLALVLLLGIGVDYGIFLLEHSGDGSAWLAVVLGAASTWLAFGLLGLSGTPALRAFGLTLLFGIALVWLFSPLLRAVHVKGEA